MRYWPTKTPDQVKFLGLDWGPTLSKLGDPTIIDSDWTTLHGDAQHTAGVIDEEGRRTVTQISGGTPGIITVFRNTVTLSDTQVLDEDVTIKCRA